MARITKELITTFTAIATDLAEKYSPYKYRSVKYFIDGKPHYMFKGKSFTEQELTDRYIETAVKDMTIGYSDRSIGFYNTWFRYSHYDNGRAYDAGQQYASDNVKCPKKVRTIVCNY